MIVLLLALAQPADAGSRIYVGASGGMLAARSSARHGIHPAGGITATFERSWWSGTVEGWATGWSNGADAYRYRTGYGRASLVVSAAIPGLPGDRPRKATVHFGLGPALSLRAGSVTWGDERQRFTDFEAGARVRAAILGGLGKARIGKAYVGWCVHLGATSRGVDRVDFDVGLGAGWLTW